MFSLPNESEKSGVNAAVLSQPASSYQCDSKWAQGRINWSFCARRDVIRAAVRRERNFHPTNWLNFSFIFRWVKARRELSVRADNVKTVVKHSHICVIRLNQKATRDPVVQQKNSRWNIFSTHLNPQTNYRASSAASCLTFVGSMRIIGQWLRRINIWLIMLKWMSAGSSRGLAMEWKRRCVTSKSSERSDKSASRDTKLFRESKWRKFRKFQPTMGNYCSSSQKKDKDNVSEKSEEWVNFCLFFIIYLFLIRAHITNISAASSSSPIFSKSILIKNKKHERRRCRLR